MAAVVCAATALAPAPASASGLVDLTRLHVTIGEHGVLSLAGDFLAVGGYVEGMAVTSEAPEIPEVLPDDPFGFFRLALTPSLTLHGSQWPVFQAYKVHIDFELTADVWDEALDTPLTYDPTHRERSNIPSPRLMEAYALAAGKNLAIKAGLVRSSWGLGMLANSGRREPATVESSPFGFSRHADRVMRLQLAYFPLDAPKSRAGEPKRGPPLTLAVAVDGVVEDDTSSWAEGDRTFQFIAAATGQHEGFSGGLYAVHRSQDHAGGGSTSITVVDVQAKQTMGRGAVRGWAAAEAALLVGSTTYTRSAIVDKPFNLLTLGGVLRVGLEHELLHLVVEGGMGEGDDNPFDAELHAFSFDREHRVGLLMFREYMRKVSAVGAYNLEDPTYRAEPSRGFDLVATGGALRGVMYVNPRVALLPFEGFTIFLGYLHAQTEGSYTDPWQSGLQGGTSAGPHGAIGRSELGHELDVGLDYRFDAGPLRLALRLEGAWLLPGDAFEDPVTGQQPDLFGAWLHAGLRW